MSEEKKRERDGSQCWRCGMRLFIFGMNTTTLVDAYNCTLCNDCRNDWDVYIRDHSLWLKLVSAQDEMQMIFCMTCSDGRSRCAQVDEVRSRMNEIRKQLFILAETWASDVIERPAPPPPPPPTEAELAEVRERRKIRLRAQLRMIEKQETEQGNISQE